MAVYVRIRDLATFRARLRATGTTQADLARAANTSRQRISQIASGATISVTAAAAIEYALGMPPGSLFEVTAPGDLVAPYTVPAA